MNWHVQVQLKSSFGHLNLRLRDMFARAHQVKKGQKGYDLVLDCFLERSAPFREESREALFIFSSEHPLWYSN